MPSSARAEHWPPRWVRKHGAIYYRPPADVRERWDGKAWFRLGATEPEAWATWYARTEAADDVRTMADVLDVYARRELSRLAPKSQRDYARTLTMLRQVFGKMLPAHVRPTHVAKMMDRMAPVAANRARAVLSSVMATAVRIGAIDRNPVREVRRNTETARRRYVTHEELAAFIGHCSPFLRAYVQLKLLTGLRQGQLLSLRLSDWDGSRLTVPAAKGGVGAQYSGDGLPEAIDAVMALRRGRAVRGLTLFATRNGSPYSGDGFRSLWQRAMQAYAAMGATRFTEHDLRAKVASDADDPRRARDLLGHTTSAITERVYQRRSRVVRVLSHARTADGDESST